LGEGLADFFLVGVFFLPPAGDLLLPLGLGLALRFGEGEADFFPFLVGVFFLPPAGDLLLEGDLLLLLLRAGLRLLLAGLRLRLAAFFVFFFAGLALVFFLPPWGMGRPSSSFPAFRSRTRQRIRIRPRRTRPRIRMQTWQLSCQRVSWQASWQFSWQRLSWQRASSSWPRATCSCFGRDCGFC